MKIPIKWFESTSDIYSWYELKKTVEKEWMIIVLRCSIISSFFAIYLSLVEAAGGRITRCTSRYINNTGLSCQRIKNDAKGKLDILFYHFLKHNHFNYFLNRKYL